MKDLVYLQSIRECKNERKKCKNKKNVIIGLAFLESLKRFL